MSAASPERISSGRRGDGLDASRGVAVLGEQRPHRWDSLRLFTPARFDGLPGSRFPAPADREEALGILTPNPPPRYRRHGFDDAHF
jgi:hypothetical protein